MEAPQGDNTSPRYPTLLPFREFGMPEHPVTHHGREQKEWEISSRNAIYSIVLVMVFISGGLYFFGSDLNRKAAIREQNKLVADDLRSSEDDRHLENDRNTAATTEPFLDDEEKSLDNFDILGE